MDDDAPTSGSAHPGEGLASELAREQAHVDRALARLEELRLEAVARERSTLGGALDGTPQGLYERDVAALAATARRSDLEGAGEGLVFGRLDLESGDVHHIGRLGLRDADQEPIVVDWRAPAAAAFYRATATDPQRVVRRRTLTTAGPRVTGLEDELLQPERADELEGTVVVGDGAFLAAVSRERGPQMRDIVATIQREQDEAVRAPDDGALVVTGGPGTGKTAVALHRVAYLMYARREFYGRRGVLVVGPSRVFVDYIGAVLPALGETSVRLAALGEVPHLPRGLELGFDEPPASSAVKGSARMARVLRRTVSSLTSPPVTGDLELSRFGTGFAVTADEVARRRTEVARGQRSANGGRTAFVGKLVESAWRVWERRPGATRTESDDREDFGLWLRHDEGFQRQVDALWPVLDAVQVLQALRSGAIPLDRVAKGTLRPDEVAAVVWGEGLSAADAALLDELHDLVGPPPPPEADPDDDWDELAELDQLAAEHGVTTFADRTRQVQRNLAEELDYRTFAHVVVDEAQDVTPMQWRMLGRRARGATWTIVGDWAQSAWGDVTEVRDALQSAIGRSRVREATLTTNYRTSTEIAAVAARLLARVDPAAEPPAAVRSTGVEPAVVGDLAGAVVSLLASVTGTVGVVTPFARREEVRAALPPDPRLSVVDTWQVKGLEYDGCVVVDPAGMVGEALSEVAGLRSLYVALTRATQRLVVVESREGELEELLSGPPVAHPEPLPPLVSREPAPRPARSRTRSRGPRRR
jgi:hypothetical protein